VIILADGEQWYQEGLMEWALRYPKKIGFRIGFDERLAHSIIAGSDILLIPSRYEPCGLTQMYAMKYGTVLVARTTGGLEDSVHQFDPQTGEGTGFTFKQQDAGAFLEAIRTAVSLFDEEQASWGKLIQKAMKAIFPGIDQQGNTLIFITNSLANKHTIRTSANFHKIFGFIGCSLDRLSFVKHWPKKAVM
jgi:starch synthase